MTLRAAALLLSIGLLAAGRPAHADDALYRALGQRPGIATLMQDFVPRLKTDAQIGHFFKDTAVRHLVQQLGDQVCEVAGGPCTLDGPDMKTAHADMTITPADFNRLVELLQDAMDAQGLPFRVQNRLLARLAPMHRDIVSAPGRRWLTRWPAAGPGGLRLPSIDGLRAFEAAARLGSFERAADELASAPAPSASASRRWRPCSAHGAAAARRQGAGADRRRARLPATRCAPALGLLAAVPQHRRPAQRRAAAARERTADLRAPGAGAASSTPSPRGTRQLELGADAGRALAATAAAPTPTSRSASATRPRRRHAC